MVKDLIISILWGTFCILLFFAPIIGLFYSFYLMLSANDIGQVIIGLFILGTCLVIFSELKDF